MLMHIFSTISPFRLLTVRKKYCIIFSRGKSIGKEHFHFMITLNGKGVCSGIAIGKISYFTKSDPAVQMLKVENPYAEIDRVEKAKSAAKRQLSELYEKALQEVGGEDAAIFNIQRMLIDDLDYNNAIRKILTEESVNAEFAVAVAADHFETMLASMSDDYMRARSADVRDISDRIIRCLNGADQENVSVGKKIVCADDLAPSETVQMDKENVLAFVTVHGSSNSHTAILARTMGIPAVVDVGRGLTRNLDGAVAAVDGAEGVVYINPDEKILARLEARQQNDMKRRDFMNSFRDSDTVTADGRRIKLYANINSASDIKFAIENGAEGIGLMRSEFLYMNRSDYPDEETQFSAYKTVLESMPDKRVIIRTLDIGADKKADYFGLEKEENPALGYRAIRICLDRKDMFKTQLRALYRASAYGRLAIMFPMIISVEEVRAAKACAKEVMEELKKENIPYDENAEIGIMIETPAAAIISDMLEIEADFFSIGTNDLTQYTLAVDRQNPVLENHYDPYHPALKRMIKTVIDNAHAAGIWVGVCGELGGDVNMTEWFIRSGIDELSAAPSAILELRKRISEINLKM